MKILYLANIRIPTEKAHGIQIMKMCEAFGDHGIEVELVVPWRFNHLKEDAFSYYGVKKNFKIKKVFSLDLVRFGKVGFLVQSISFAISSSFYSIIKKRDAFYSRDELPIWPLTFLRKNVVYEAHMPRYNFMVKRFTKIVAISNGLKKFYIDNEISSNRILVAHDGVDVEDFNVTVNKEDLASKLGIPLEKPVVMYLGRLDPWKGVETLLQASRLLPNVTVVVAGEGSQLREFKINYPNVIFLGGTLYRDLPYNQKVADVLVIPNSAKSDVSRLYTSPLKVFAHMASGVPIVASDLPSIREVLNESCAYFFEPDNSESLKEALGRALVGGDKKGGLNIASTYSWKNRAEKIITFTQ
ncbi:MAG: glycosyltransferase family 4 protein [Candidatus Paceibacterota bacterium]